MKKGRSKPTTADNLETKFDRGEEVLDYFDVENNRVIEPPSMRSAVKTRLSGACSENSTSGRRIVVRESRANYHKQK